ncbi:MAG: hypothetical protein J1F03_04575 [Oscillospiraceae bacterium]|nr:hypothetical protein [Oscillospiraceae bacterium]
MLKKIIAFMLAGIMSVLMSGCMDTSVENMLSPPKLLDEQNEIYNELIKSVGQGVKLVYPRSGEYRSAFVIYDFDEEPGDEALVFYESKNTAAGEVALRMRIFDKVDGKFETVYDIACAGSEVERIRFERLGKGGDINIIVQYTLLNQTEKVFSVYKYENHTPVERYSSTYVCLDVFDINGDGADELITVNYDKTTQTSSAMMFADEEEGFAKLSQTNLYGGTADYIGVTAGMLSDDKAALFLDYSKGSGQSGTDVIYCVSNKLYCPNSDNSNIVRVTNDYMSEIYCCDIDGDGLVEIPSTRILPGYETQSRNEQLYAVEWYTVASNRFVLEHYSYFSNKYHFALIFPSRWQGVVTAVPDFTRSEVVFISYDERMGLDLENAAEIMRVRVVDKDDERGLEDAKELMFIGETDETYYCIAQQSGSGVGKLALTESELKNCFKIL